MLQGAKESSELAKRIPTFKLPSSNLAQISLLRFLKSESFFTLESFVSAVGKVRFLHRTFCLITELILLFFTRSFGLAQKRHDGTKINQQRHTLGTHFSCALERRSVGKNGSFKRTRKEFPGQFWSIQSGKSENLAEWKIHHLIIDHFNCEHKKHRRLGYQNETQMQI